MNSIAHDFAQIERRSSRPADRASVDGVILWAVWFALSMFWILVGSLSFS